MYHPYSTRFFFAAFKYVRFNHVHVLFQDDPDSVSIVITRVYAFTHDGCQRRSELPALCGSPYASQVDCRYPVPPQCGKTYGAQRSDRHLILHRPGLYTELCPCGRHIWSEIIVLTLGIPPLPLRALCAMITSCPRVRTVVLLLRFERLLVGDTSDPTLRTSCLNSSMPMARMALLHLPFSGMTC